MTTAQLARRLGVAQSMVHENERVLEDDERVQLERLARQLIDGPGSALWDER